jgi:hypothetical protein
VQEGTVNDVPRTPVRPWFCRWRSALGCDTQCSAATAASMTCGGAVEHPVASAPPSRLVRVWSGALQWRWRTSCPEPVAPTPSYNAA